MKIFLALCIFSGTWMGLTAQNAVCDSSKWAKDGTYDIINLTKEKEVFTTDILCLIEGKRNETEVVDYQVSPMTLIRIYPRKQLKTNTSSK